VHAPDTWKSASDGSIMYVTQQWQEFLQVTERSGDALRLLMAQRMRLNEFDVILIVALVLLVLWFIFPLSKSVATDNVLRPKHQPRAIPDQRPNPVYEIPWTAEGVCRLHYGEPLDMVHFGGLLCVDDELADLQ
jgi:hypothetical protein